MFSQKICLVGVLFVCSFYGAIRADDCSGTPAKTFSLCHDLQTLINIAPRQSILSLIRTHLSSDTRFRRAVNFMLSPQLKATTQMIDDSAVYQSLQSQFSTAGVNITDINSISKIFDCLIIPYIQEAMGGPSSRSVSLFEQKAEKRSLNTFVQEVSQLISENSSVFVKTLKNLLAESENFTEFYAIVRNPSFRVQVTQSLTNREVARSVKILRHNQIDLCKLVEYGFKLLDLGPSI